MAATSGPLDPSQASFFDLTVVPDEQIPEPLRWIVLDAECFVQAFPPRAPGGPVPDDLLAAVDGA
jgi:hypothetical protein